MLAAIESLVSRDSYRVGVFSMSAVPATYLLHVWLHCCATPPAAGSDLRRRGAGAARFWELLFFPLRGGGRHAVFQVFSWALWGVSALIAVPLYMSLAGRGALLPAGVPRFNLPRLIPKTHEDVASGAVAVSSFVGELFMLKALLVFERPSAPGMGARGAKRLRWGRILEVVGPRAASLLVALMGFALAATGCGLLLSLELMPDTPSRVLYCCLALLCMLVGASTTHGLGGHLRYGMTRYSSSGHGPRPSWDGSGAEELMAADGSTAGGGGGGSGSTQWRFFQPFSGGTAFVTTQAIGWTLFSSTCVIVMLLAKQLVAGVGYCLRSWVLSAGALMVATQLVLGISVLTFQQRRRARKLLQPMMKPRQALRRGIDLFLPVFMIYMPLHTFVAASALAFVLLPARVAAAGLVGLLVPTYALTLRGYPAHTGCRRWPACCTWFSSAIEDSLVWWAGELHVIADFEGTAMEVADAAEAEAAEAEGTQQALQAEAAQPQAAEAAQQAADKAAAAAKADKKASCGGVRRRAAAAATGATAAAAEPAPAQEAAAAAISANGNGDAGIHCGAGPAPSPPLRRFVLGLHPHGSYPTGAGFVPLMPSVQRLFPGLKIVTLTATIIHYLPAIREIAAWAGFRQVSHGSFRKALHDEGAVLLCPGGQAELVYVDRAFPPRGGNATGKGSGGSDAPPPAADGTEQAGQGQGQALPAAKQPQEHDDQQQQQQQQEELPAGLQAPAPASGAGPGPRPPQAQAQAQADLLLTPHVRRQLVLYAGHKGFVRMALEEGAWLVPVLAIGEVLHLRNIINAPVLQRATYKRLGFPIPYAPAGRWGITALPLRNPLVYVVGKPLAPPAGWARELKERRAAAAAACGGSGGGGGAPAEPSQANGAGFGSGCSTGAASSHARPAAQHEQRQQRQQQQQGAHGVAGAGVPQHYVDEYHARFYAEMQALWGKYHHMHSTLKDAECVVVWGSAGPPPSAVTATGTAQHQPPSAPAS